MKKQWIYWSFVFLLGFSTCVKEPKAPVQETFAPPIEQQISYWNLPIILEVAQIEDKINQKVRGTIYVDSSFDNNNQDSIKLKIQKIGRIKLSVKGDIISWEVPLKVYFDGVVEKKMGDVMLHSYQSTDFSANLYFDSKVSITEDWRLQTETTLKDVLWLKKPKIKLAFLNFSVGKAVEKILWQKQDKVLNQLDAVIRRQVKIQKHIAKVWRDVQKPIRINKKIRPVWLIAAPKSLEVEQIEGSKGQIYVHTRIGLMLRTEIGERPKIKINETLPMASQSTRKPSLNTFNLKLLAEIGYDHINDLLADSLVDREFVIEEQTIVIKKAQVRGRGQHLIIQLDIKGATEGQVFFKGTPVYDAQQAVLKVENFDFDIQNTEMITSAADWLLHEVFRQSIHQRLSIPLDSHIDQIPNLIQQAIEKGKVGQKISVNIDQLHFSSNNIVIRPESIQMLLNVEGRAGIELDKL